MDGHIWVPIDDHSTNVYNLMCAYDEAHPLDADYVPGLDAAAAFAAAEAAAAAPQVLPCPPPPWVLGMSGIWAKAKPK